MDFQDVTDWLDKNKKFAVILLAVAIIAVLFLASRPAGARAITLTIPNADPAETYTIDLFDSEGKLARRQEVSGIADVTFYGLPDESFFATVTDSHGNSWTSTLITSSDGPLTWTNTTPVNPAPLASFNLTNVSANGTVALPSNVSAEQGNELYSEICCTVYDVFPCGNTTCARVDCNMTPYIGETIMLFSHLSDCLVYSMPPATTTPVTPTPPVNVSPNACGITGDFDGDGLLSAGDAAYLRQILDYIQENGTQPAGLDFDCADANSDGYLTEEDYVCVLDVSAGNVAFLGDCMDCSPSTSEVCHDGVDNDCDGQIDRDTYDEQSEAFYRSAANPANLCGCNRFTPCDMVWDIDGIVGISSDNDKEWCLEMINDTDSGYDWYSLAEIMNIFSSANWQKETGIRLYNTVSTSTLVIPNDVSLTYSNGQSGIDLATSTDGVSLTNIGTVLPSGNLNVFDPSILATNKTLFMFHTCSAGNPVQSPSSICLATSPDGMSWYSAGTVITPDATDKSQMSVPDAVLLPNGEVWVYYTYDMTGRNSIRAAVLNNFSSKEAFLVSQNWRRENLAGVQQNNVDPDVFLISKCPLIMGMFFSSMGAKIRFAVSTDGKHWTVSEGPVILPTLPVESQGIGDPDVVRLPGKYRMYYFGRQSKDSGANILSAVLPFEFQGTDFENREVTDTPNCIGFCGGDMDMATLVATGVRWINTPSHFSWQWIEPEEGIFNFTATDALVSATQSSGLEIMATVWPYSDWDQASCHGSSCEYPSALFLPQDDKPQYMFIPKSRCTPCNMADYKRFLSKVVERYDGDGLDDMPGLTTPLKSYEILDEPENGLDNLPLTFYEGTPQEYVSILRASYEAIKSVCSDCRVVLGGAAGIQEDSLEYFRQVFEAGGDSYIDVANVHYINSGNLADLNVGAFRDLMIQTGVSADKPIWAGSVQFGPIDGERQNSDSEIIASVRGALQAGASKVFVIPTGSSNPSLWSSLQPLCEEVVA